MHDPIDKVFQIQGHEKRSAELLQIFSLDMPNDKHWKTADAIASGFERGQVPSYNSDPQKNGAVDFTNNPVITHPISAEGTSLNLPDLPDAQKVFEELKQFLVDTVGVDATSDYLGTFGNKEGMVPTARFLFTHLVLRFLLAEKNVAGLGSLWHRLPADSRFPDHTIWQHNQLTSALYTCISLGNGDADNVALMVFSITPVQGFIEKARKLRDYWLGSVILSWLAFEGIRWVIENLGPDHILYPSLIDQPLVAEYLRREWNVSDRYRPSIWDHIPRGIASFPNKFVALVPANRYEEIKNEITTHVNSEWEKLASLVCDYLPRKSGILKDSESMQKVKGLFDRQVKGYWDIRFSANRLFTANDYSEAQKLLHPDRFENQFDTLKIFNDIIADKPYRKSGEGVLYSVSHSLSQAMLASSKMKRDVTRQHEGGEKCHLCGEFEVLHHKPWQEGMSAREYSDNINELWRSLHNPKSSDFKENEKLCSICTVKRMVDEALKDSDHILSHMFTENVRFPSTTEFALSNYFERNNVPEKDREAFAHFIHRDEEYHVKGKPRVTNRDRYYAILVMDGDRMGDLINGITLGSTWQSVMHPDIVERLGGNFDSLYKDNWKKLFGRKRILTPAVHAAISEALGDFSMYGVPDIVAHNGGQLVYAGGDDVFAVLPIDNVLSAAREIRDVYCLRFIHLDLQGNSISLDSGYSLEPGKLSLSLGKANGISISAAILIAHHKEPLSRLISDAQDLLKVKAKGEMDRNACAVELRKRSGGSRYFARKWDDHASWDAFEKLIREKNLVSNSLIYRLESMRPGIESILRKEDADLHPFLGFNVKRSASTDKERVEEISKLLASVIIDPENRFDPQGLIIAGFLADNMEVTE